MKPYLIFLLVTAVLTSGCSKSAGPDAPDIDPGNGQLSDEYFTYRFDGVEQPLKTFQAELDPGQMSFGGYDGQKAVIIYAFGNHKGLYTPGQAHAPGFATIEYWDGTGKHYVHFREADCLDGGLHYSPGEFKITRLAARTGEYTEGSYYAELYQTTWCSNNNTRILSGKFRVKMK